MQGEIHESACMFVCMNICRYVCTNTWMNLYVCMHACIYVCVNVCMFAFIFNILIVYDAGYEFALEPGSLCLQGNCIIHSPIWE